MQRVTVEFSVAKTQLSDIIKADLVLRCIVEEAAIRANRSAKPTANGCHSGEFIMSRKEFYKYKGVTEQMFRTAIDKAQKLGIFRDTGRRAHVKTEKGKGYGQTCIYQFICNEYIPAIGMVSNHTPRVNNVEQIIKSIASRLESNQTQPHDESLNTLASNNL